MNTVNLYLLVAVATLASSLAVSAEPQSKLPNIVYIFADDFGCGDLSRYEGALSP